jgi:hypothetical protein
MGISVSVDVEAAVGFGVSAGVGVLGTRVSAARKFPSLSSMGNRPRNTEALVRLA